MLSLHRCVFFLTLRAVYIDTSTKKRQFYEFDNKISCAYELRLRVLDKIVYPTSLSVCPYEFLELYDNKFFHQSLGFFFKAPSALLKLIVTVQE
jgi:hypothetical protein